MSGFEEMGIKVKVERMLVLFCSCAVQREVQRKLETIQRSFFIYLLLHYFSYFICDIFISITTIFVFLLSR